MNKERIYKGIPASQGISIGEAYLYTKKQIIINTALITEEDVPKEIEEFQKAIELSQKELRKIYNIAIERIGVKNSKIFEAQLEILNDTIFIEKVINRIREEKRSASYIFDDEINKLGSILLSAQDDYMRERFEDINDVRNRVVRNMSREKLISKVTENSIIVAHELTPGDTILFSRRKAQGYVTDTGGINSHAAIISRALNIPAVVGVKVISQNIRPKEILIVDGIEGIVIASPNPETLEKYEEKLRKFREQEEKLFGLIDLPSITLDGKTVDLAVNIDFEDEINFVKNCKECGIGLYRTEHMFIERGEFPSEAEQIEEYTYISEAAYPKSATIRTYDIGGDKLLPSSEKEPNPYLGWRGIRICLDRIGIFKEQIRAILKSSKLKNLKVMLPMISSLEEIRCAKKIFEEVKKELDNDPFYSDVYDKNIPFGAMIEVPSAVILADEIAKEVDFFSIGTNDLIQYILAVDRGNELVADLYKEFHPAVIRTLKNIVEAAHRNNIKVSICGEMASNPLSSIVLVGLELDELSVLPSLYTEIKQIIRACSFSDAKKLINSILNYSTEEEIRNAVKNFYEIEIKPYLNQIT
ncbi:MAG: phosphoenolpyruvate--protein phosphotransferase [Ignavibacteria bacterium]|nr:phosphoenolpyruvate--protein phosphotransferase [Ignavibacteria bacterium]